MYYIISNELYHHGIKGMRWGVRKDRSSPPNTKVTIKIEKKKTHAEKVAERKDRNAVFKSGIAAMNAYHRFSNNEKRFNKFQEKEANGGKVNPKKYEKIVKQNLKSEAILQKSLTDIDQRVQSLGKEVVKKTLMDAAHRNATISSSNGVYYIEEFRPDLYKKNLKVVDYALNRPRS